MMMLEVTTIISCGRLEKPLYTFSNQELESTSDGLTYAHIHTNTKQTLTFPLGLYIYIDGFSSLEYSRF